MTARDIAHAPTLPELFRRRAERAPDRVALRFSAGGTWTPWSWGVLVTRALAGACGLEAGGLRPGDHALLLVPEPDLAVTAIFAAWMLGVVPIPIGVPFRMTDPAAFVAGLRITAERLRAKALITSRVFAEFASSEESVRIITIEEAASHAAGEPSAAAYGSAPALIQLTSGSTGSPRGVMLAHERLAEHMACMSAALPSHDDSVAVSWLPLHHDMGLIGGLLFPLYNDFCANMLSPAEFRGRPLSWLEAMSHMRATICAAPPSAYAIATRMARLASAKGLRFDAWECAMVGAEPISASVLRGFADAFGSMGFRAEAFFPVYGLAEATVAVTFPRLLAATRVDRVDRATLERHGRAESVRQGAPLDASIELVGCGTPIPRTELRIVPEDDGRAGDRVVGEIEVRAPTLMLGYFEERDVTTSTIVDGWLRTGDLGYIADEQLFITGRKKDLIIRAGHNVMPHAIEEVVSEVPGVRSGCVVAAGVRQQGDETELVHVVAETKEDAATWADLVLRIRGALEARGMVADQIHLVAPSTLPKTTSGKLRRRAVAEALREGRPLESMA